MRRMHFIFFSPLFFPPTFFYAYQRQFHTALFCFLFILHSPKTIRNSPFFSYWSRSFLPFWIEFLLADFSFSEVTFSLWLNLYTIVCLVCCCGCCDSRHGQNRIRNVSTRKLVSDDERLSITKSPTPDSTTSWPSCPSRLVGSYSSIVRLAGHWRRQRVRIPSSFGEFSEPIYQRNVCNCGNQSREFSRVNNGRREKCPFVHPFSHLTDLSLVGRCQASFLSVDGSLIGCFPSAKIIGVIFSSSALSFCHLFLGVEPFFLSFFRQ